jgi:Uma2 family endonuclease
MVPTHTKPVTVEELWELRDEPYRLALIDGELYRMPGAGGTHGEIQLYVGAHLLPLVLSRGLGKLFVDTGFRLFRDRETTLFPDVAFVRSDRLPPADARERFLDLVPDLAIEIDSPTEYPKVRADKLAAYLSAGTPCVWRLYPRSRTVEVHRTGRDMVRLGPDDTLDGGDVLPGFAIRVEDLFAPPRLGG